MRKKIKKLYNKVTSILITFLSTSRFGAKIYYLIFNTSFNREMYAVINGKRKYFKETSKKNKSNKYLLIRNTHKIEKGISMRNRRGLFALDFIEETLDSFIFLYKNKGDIYSQQLKWSENVLEEYFNVTESHPLLDKLQNRFASTINSKEANSNVLNLIPYSRDKSTMSNINYNDFLNLTKQRRSVRWYQDKEVELELVDKAIEAALQSPSACNRQPFEFRVIKDESLLKEVSALPMGTTGYAYNIPLLIVMVGNLDAYFSERDRHIIYIDASLASMSFMLALETLGLSSCSINWPDIEKREKKMEKLLKLDKHQRPIMLMSVGYAEEKGMIPFSCKRSVDEARIIH
jgi:nitroreductase